MTSPTEVRHVAQKIDAPEDRRLGADLSGRVQRPSNVGLALRLLEVIAGRAEAAGAAELGLAVGVSGAKLQRGLNSLVDAGLVSHDAVEQTYHLAAKSVYLAALIHNNAPLPRIAAPILEALAAETGETATLNAYRPQEGAAVVIAAVESAQSLRYAFEPGEAVPLFAGACGKAILAFLPPTELARILARHGLDAASESVATELHRLDRDLATIRSDGYAIASGERLAGAVEFAAPVFNAPDRIFGSLGVTAPKERLLPPYHHGQSVRRQADRLSELLGCIGRSPVAMAAQSASSA